jgi:hypothetical protein
MPKLERVTDRWLQKAATEKVQEEFWDSSKPGFYVRVSRAGNRSFFYSYYSPFDSRKRSLPGRRQGALEGFGRRM